MKKILYISCHAVLEYDELSLLTEIGHDVFSLGAYTDPTGHLSLPRPGIKNMRHRPDLVEVIAGMPRTELRFELLNEFDTIIVMHTPEIIEQNWDRIKNKDVIWRTIGQSTPGVEKRMRKYRDDGLKIVRYSPMESKLKNYVGGDVTIRFYKDQEEFKDWVGTDKKIINFSQSLKGRRVFCGYDQIMEVTAGLPFKVYGPGNEDLGPLNGGSLPFDLMKGQIRDARAMIYRGTWPASYTLAFIEGLMTGIPMVCFGPVVGDMNKNEGVETYEIHKIIQHGDEGFVFDDIAKIKSVLKRLLDDYDYAKSIGEKGREKAIRLFGKEGIKDQWQAFLESI